MQKLKLGLDLDNYPEIIELKIIRQELIEDGGHRAVIGLAETLISKELFVDLLESSSDIFLMNTKTGNPVRGGDFHVDNVTLKIEFFVPRRSYTRGRRRC